MKYQEALEKLEKYGQAHLLKYFNELTPASQDKLLAQINEIDFSSLASRHNQSILAAKGVITPLKAMDLDEIGLHKQRFRDIGLSKIRNGKVGAVLLAGGMGTRLGSDHPKGMYDIGLTKPVYIFERLIENIQDVARSANFSIPLYIMTSDKNHDVTIAFFEEHNYFGYVKSDISFFKQEMAPASDYNGKVFLEAKDTISTSPNGNGGWYSSMAKCGLTNEIKARGIEWLNVFAVDNVLQRICDPVFIGAVSETGCVSGAKVVRKNARDERIGYMCLEDGRPSIVEYYDMTDELMDARDEKGEYAYNFGVILNYLFQVEALDEIMAKNLPLHVVDKKIICLDDEGNVIHPDKPNGYKYEQLVLDMIHELESCLPYEVAREYEFAPIKNLTGVDSVESARKLCLDCGIEL
jgi:UDP-N-acetylglucosamine/UDP-N-acetylgalactosamine diphosphorylase